MAPLLRHSSTARAGALLALVLCACSGDGGDAPRDASSDAATDAGSESGGGPLRPPDSVCQAASFLPLGCKSYTDSGVVPDAGAGDGGGAAIDASGPGCVTVSGSTSGAKNSFELPAGGACGLSTRARGPDRFYKVYFGAKSGLGTIQFESDFKSVVYLLQTTCSGECVLGYKTSKLKTVPPTSGDYILVVDGETAADKGSFSLYIYEPGA